MKNIFILPLTILIFCLIPSCSDSFLDEKPLDFMSGENSYETKKDFEASVATLYYLIRREFYDRDDYRPYDYLYGTDIVFDGQPHAQRHTNMVAAYHPTGYVIVEHWRLLYKLISEANTIISRLPESQVEAEDKVILEAKAKFFRAFGYRTLAYLYGGVPIYKEEVTSAKVDYVRASRNEVLEFAIEDLEFASKNLPEITKVRDGEISNLAAYHLLSEVYIANKQYKEAVQAASTVINNSEMKLMENRFGSRANENPGDVYWDLFRKNNQNRASGNKESIWVIQFEVDVDGGGLQSGDIGGSYRLERHHAPFVRDVKANGMNPFTWPISDYTGGRGIGWAISTKYFTDAIWQSDFDNDIRNANHNFVRKFKVTNANYASRYGDTISTQDPPPGVKVPSREFYAYQTKCTTPYNHPENLYDNKQNFLLKSTAGGTYTDQYMFRLAETYLLRAEAYLGDGDKGNAAKDINVVRQRANASPVQSGDVNIEYILDERMRELGVEEKRRLTLMRLGLIYERVKKCNPYYANEIQEYHNLWPIPQGEIEANHGAVLEQNPGYEQ